MPAKMVIELPGGNKVLFGGRGAVTGLSEVGRGGLMQAASGKFEKALTSLGDLVSTLENAIDRLAKRPDKIEMELRASLSSECDLWIVSGDGEAEFKVTLSWGKSD
jgi:hypothetical protein